MIGLSIALLKKQLCTYLEGQAGWTSTTGNCDVHVENIGLFDLNTNTKEGIVISLINIEMEHTLKNFGTTRKVTGGVAYKNPSIYTNLFILFSSVVEPEKGRYRKSLTWLSYVINFFQMKNIFTYANSPDSLIWNSTEWNKPTPEQKMAYKLILDPFPLKLDQTNQLWSTLGSKQVPHVMFKCRLLELRDEQILRTGSIISNVNSSEIIN